MAQKTASGLIGADVPSLDNRPPFGNFCLVVRGQCIWRLQRTRRHFETQLRKAFARYWICQRVYYRGIEFGDYILRRALGHPHSRPQGHVEAGQTSFIHGRNICRGRHSLLIGYCIRPDFAGTNLIYGIRGLVDHYVDLSSHQIVERWAGAAIGHELQFDTGDILKIDTANMRARAGAGGTRRNFSGVLLRPCNKFLKRLCRQVVFC